jgi:branched-chain amino acid transport system permease protein
VDVIIAQSVNGLTLGATYALVAAGMSMIFGVLQLVNWAHGQFYMVGAYVLYLFAVQLAVPYPIAAGLTVAAMACFGVVFEVLAVRPVIGHSWQIQLVVTLGASVLLINGAAVMFGTFPLRVASPLSTQMLVMGNVSVAWQRIVALGVTMATFLILSLVIQRTRYGKAMRAVSQNREACVACGINPQRIGVITFGIGSALAGLAAALVAPLGNIAPDTGSLLIFKGFAVIIMGGLGSVTGVIPAALVIGLAEAFTAQYISADFVDAAAFVIMIVVLVLRPQGLFGRRAYIS